MQKYLTTALRKSIKVVNSFMIGRKIYGGQNQIEIVSSRIPDNPMISTELFIFVYNYILQNHCNF